MAGCENSKVVLTAFVRQYRPVSPLILCRIQAGRSEGIRGQPEPVEIGFLRRGGLLRGLRDGRTGQVEGRGEDISGIGVSGGT